MASQTPPALSSEDALRLWKQKYGGTSGNSGVSSSAGSSEDSLRLWNDYYKKRAEAPKSQQPQNNEIIDFLQSRAERGESSGWDYLSALTGALDTPLTDTTNRVIEGIQSAKNGGSFFDPWDASKGGDNIYEQFMRGWDKSLSRNESSWKPWSPNFAPIQGLAEIGKTGKDVGDLLDKAGWQEREALPTDHWYNTNPFERKKGTLDAGDVVEFFGAPSTWLSGGTSGAAKLAKLALKSEATKIAKEYGLQVSKKTADAIENAVQKKVYDDVLTSTKSEAAALEQATSASKAARNRIDAAVKTARIESQNAALVFNPMFVPYAKVLLKKPKFLQKGAQLVGEQGAKGIDEALTKAGIVGDARDALLKNIYKIDSISQMTMDMSDDLFRRLKQTKNQLLVNMPSHVADLMNEHNFYIRQLLTLPDADKIFKNSNLSGVIDAKDLMDTINEARKAKDTAQVGRVINRLKEDVKQARELVFRNFAQQDFGANYYGQLVGRGVPVDIARALDQRRHYKQYLMEPENATPNQMFNQESPDVLAYMYKNNPDALKALLDETPVLEEAFTKKFAEGAPDGTVSIPEHLRYEEPMVKRVLSDKRNFTDFRRKATELIRTNRFTNPMQAVERMSEEGAYVRDIHGTDISPFTAKIRDNPAMIGKVYKALNAFSTASLGVKDTFVDSAARLIRNSKNFKAGMLKRYERVIRDITITMQHLTEEDIKMIPYILENRFPESFGLEKGEQTAEFIKSLFAQNEDLRLASESIQKLLADLGQVNLRTGLVKQLRDSYFPHIRQLSQEKIDELMGRIEASSRRVEKLTGISTKVTFNKERMTFGTLAELDDTIAKLQTNLEDAINAGEDELVDAIKEQLANLDDLFVRDPVQAISSYIYQQVKATAFRDLYRDLIDRGLIRKDKGVSEDFVELLVEDVRQMGLDEFINTADFADKVDNVLNGTGYYIHPAIIDALHRTNGYFKNEYQMFNNIIQGGEMMMSILKNLMLNITPKQAFANIVGNLHNCFLAGMPVSAIGESYSILKKYYQNPELLAPEEKALIEEAFEKGILGQGHAADYITHTSDAAKGKLRAGAEWLENSALVQANRSLSDAVDDLTRFALYKSSRDIHGSADYAANIVREYLFNYHELTAADRVMRLLIPFWTWQKNNIPLQLMNFLRMPRFYMLQDQLKYNSYNEEQRASLPEYVTRGYWNIQGAGVNAYRLGLPSEDLSELSDTGLPKYLLSSTAPPLRLLAELAFNERLQSGAPIDRSAATGEPADLGEYYPYALSQFGGSLGSMGYSSYKDLTEANRPLADVLFNVLEQSTVGARYKPPISKYQDVIPIMAGQEPEKPRSFIDDLRDLFAGEGGQ